MPQQYCLFVPNSNSIPPFAIMPSPYQPEQTLSEMILDCIILIKLHSKVQKAHSRQQCQNTVVLWRTISVCSPLDESKLINPGLWCGSHRQICIWKYMKGNAYILPSIIWLQHFILNMSLIFLEWINHNMLNNSMTPYTVLTHITEKHGEQWLFN